MSNFLAPIQYIPSHLISDESAERILSNPNAFDENVSLARDYRTDFTPVAVNENDKYKYEPQNPLVIDIKGGYNDFIPYILLGIAAIAIAVTLKNRKGKQ